MANITSIRHKRKDGSDIIPDDLEVGEIGIRIDAGNEKIVFKGKSGVIHEIESNAAGDQTPAEILAALLTVDGSGSGLDADLLDGLEATAFQLLSQKGQAGGYASLDGSGLVPASQLPSYVDDVLEYDLESNFPESGETGKIYVETTTGKIFRWTGSVYVEISPDAGAPVASVNGQTGTVVLDTGDITAVTDANYVTNAQLATITNLSGTNSGDVTVTDSAEIDFTLTGQDITAVIKPGSIDETKLDTTVNLSLDLADSAVQPGDIDTVAELNASLTDGNTLATTADITAAGHDPVTVTDSTHIDFTLTGQDVTAVIKPGSITETELNASVNASLDLADSAVQLSQIDSIAELNAITGETILTAASNVDADTLDGLDSTAFQLLSQKGVANGYASLDGSGLVPASQLPSYVDDVLEYDLEVNFPVTGETGKIYVETTTGKIFRWSGSVYVEVSPDAGAPVSSVNTQTGAVVLDADDIADDTTAHKFVTSSDLTNLANLSGTNSGDQTAAQVPYTNTISSLAATDVQAALDEIEGRVDANDAKVSNVSTNLSIGNKTATTLDIVSSDGTDATIPSATGTEAGLLAAADKLKLDGISDTDDQTAAEVPYTNTTSGLTATNVQAALDEIEGRVDANDAKVSNVTTDLGYTASPTNGVVTSSDGTDATLTLANGTNAGLLAPADFTKLGTVETNAAADQSAAEVPYTNTTSGLTAIDVQAALDEIEARVDANDAKVGYTDAAVDNHLNTSTAAVNEVLSWTGADYDWVAQSGGADDQTAAEVPYTNTTSGLAATDVQAALDEVAANNLIQIDFGVTGGTESTALTGDNATAVASLHVFRDMTLNEALVGLTVAPTGSIPAFDIHLNGTTIFSTTPTIDIGEKTSYTATTSAQLSGGSTTLTKGDLLEFYCDSADSGATGAGLKFYLSASADTSARLLDYTIAASDESTDLTADTVNPIATFHAPRNFTIEEILIGVTTAPVGSILTADIHLNGTTIFSTLPTIDAGEKTSVTAAAAAVLSSTSISKGDLLELFCDGVGSTTAGAGLKFYINAKY